MFFLNLPENDKRSSSFNNLISYFLAILSSFLLLFNIPIFSLLTLVLPRVPNFLKLFKLIFWRKKEEEQVEEKENEAKKLIEEKLKKQAYFVSINIIHAWEDKIESTWAIKEIFSTLTVFDHFKVNSFQL